MVADIDSSRSVQILIHQHSDKAGIHAAGAQAIVLEGSVQPGGVLRAVGQGVDVVTRALSEFRARIAAQHEED